MNVHSPLSNLDVIHSYKNWAKHYDYTFALVGKHCLKKVIGNVSKEVTGRVLDVGIGTGLAMPFYSSDINVTGIDLSKDMLQKAIKKKQKYQFHNIDLQVMDATKLSFEDNYFEAVVATFVMSVVPDPEKVLQEMARVCRPGGFIYITNHFVQEENSLRGQVEKFIAPASKMIGFHSDFSKATLNIEEMNLELVEESTLFSIFTSLKLRKNKK